MRVVKIIIGDDRKTKSIKHASQKKGGGLKDIAQANELAHERCNMIEKQRLKMRRERTWDK